MDQNWEEFLTPYNQAVEELKVKLKGMRKEFSKGNLHIPIEFVTGRVKPVNSIIEKAALRNIPLDKLEIEMQDIAGLRIMCQFVEDIHEVVRLLRNRNDMKIIEEREYIKNKKESGYRSYHIVFEYPVQLINGEKRILGEIQVRTLAMNFWATIEHSLNYKYQGEFPDAINVRLKRAAEAAFQLDEEMSQIREEIQEAQHLFSNSKRATVEKTQKD